MVKTWSCALALVVAATGVAGAGGQKDSVGVGAEAELNGIGGVSLNYDAGPFHAGGFLGYDRVGRNNGTETTFLFGARFFYHLHSTAMSDFGLGGGFGLASVPNNPGGGGMATRNTDIFLEPGFQIRVFLASNVALSFTAGLVFGTADANQIAIGGQYTAGAGVHYYFF